MKIDKYLFLKLLSMLTGSGKKSISKPDNIYPMKTSIYEIPFHSSDGKQTNLSSYKGRKILIVNTASECGLTPQYAQLQELFNEHKDKLWVIAFPANNFGGQEPGTNEEIGAFCEKNYGVTFPLMSKIDVVGKNKHPLYQWLTNMEENGWNNTEPDWNFCKYLISEEGVLLKVFPSAINPIGEEILSSL